MIEYLFQLLGVRIYDTPSAHHSIGIIYINMYVSSKERYDRRVCVACFVLEYMKSHGASSPLDWDDLLIRI